MMRSKLQTIGVQAAIACMFLLSSTAGAASFNYLYIEASEGNSSGGHTAIQFGDDIYHYQHVDSGMIRLFRRENTEFHFLYRYLQNRPMHLSRIDVSDDTLELLKDQFKWQLLTQERQFKLLDDLHKDRIFIRYLLQHFTSGHARVDAGEAYIMRLKGVGLFYPEPGHPPEPTVSSELTRQQSQSIQSLRQKVELRFGPNFLYRLRQTIESHIKALAPSHWPVLTSDLTVEKQPFSIYSFTDSYSDWLTSLYAIRALTEAPPLRSDAFFQMNQKAFRISEAERQVLRGLRNHLESSVVKLINSGRPDWGYAVLVNMARYIAIDATLLSGFWVFIDDFAENGETLRPDQYLEHNGQLRILISDARTTFSRSRQRAMAGERVSETGYSQIEMAANRYVELVKSEQHHDIRFNGEKALPSKSIGFPEGPVPDLTTEQLTTALSALNKAEYSLLQRLKQNYRYDLIKRNCVTELFRTIDQALLTPYRSGNQGTNKHVLAVKESEKRLGGYVEIPYNFIPFVSYQSVQDRYQVTKSFDLNAYRGQELTRLKARQNSVLIALRESNIVSNRLYKYNPDDAFFVFFTDDNVLLRPVFGAVNAAAGIGQSVYGFFTWPLDSGKSLKSGVTGVLMSLPELLFLNIRKGSYKYLSFNQVANTELSEE